MTGPSPQGRVNRLVQRARSSKLVASTFSYTINFGLQLVIQFGFFMLVSRLLGAEGYGVFVTITSVSILAGLIIGLGSEYVLVQRVAVKPDTFGEYFGHALIMMVLTLPLVAAPTIYILDYLIGHAIDLYHLAFLAFADLIFTRLVVLSANAFMAFDRPNWQLCVNIIASASKLLFLALAVAIVGAVDLNVWAGWYFAANALAGGIAITMTVWKLGRPRFVFQRSDMTLSLQYCIEFLSIGGMKDLDKPVVVNLMGADAGGQYAAAFRLIDAASAPVRALLYATYTRHFRNADVGRDSSVKFGLQLIPYSLGISVIVALGIFFVADYVPLVLGEDFSGTPEIMKALCIYPLLMGLSGIGADILRAIGRQKLRMALLIASSLALAPLVWYGGLLGGLVGAAIARVVLQFALIVFTWGAVVKK